MGKKKETNIKADLPARDPRGDEGSVQRKELLLN